MFYDLKLQNCIFNKDANVVRTLINWRLLNGEKLLKSFVLILLLGFSLFFKMFNSFHFLCFFFFPFFVCLLNQNNIKTRSFTSISMKIISVIFTITFISLFHPFTLCKIKLQFYRWFSDRKNKTISNVCN